MHQEFSGTIVRLLDQHKALQAQIKHHKFSPEPVQVILVSDDLADPFSVYQETEIEVGNRDYCSPIQYINLEKARYIQDAKAVQILDGARRMQDCMFVPPEQF